jgi:uncharacterized SAM-binding protein YcdF (DUF218 family)
MSGRSGINKKKYHTSRHRLASGILFLNGLILFSTLCLYVVNLLLIFPWDPAQLIKADRLEPCELIVFLGGASHERIDYAVQLLKQGYSRRLYAPYRLKNAEKKYLTEKLNELDKPVDFYSGNVTESTYKEALQTKEYVKAHNINSMLLVTSPYHSLRASWIFEKVMPTRSIISAPCCLDSSSLVQRLESYYEKETRKFTLYYLLYAWRSYIHD